VTIRSERCSTLVHTSNHTSYSPKPVCQSWEYCCQDCSTIWIAEVCHSAGTLRFSLHHYANLNTSLEQTCSECEAYNLPPFSSDGENAWRSTFLLVGVGSCYVFKMYWVRSQPSTLLFKKLYKRMSTGVAYSRNVVWTYITHFTQEMGNIILQSVNKPLWDSSVSRSIGWIPFRTAANVLLVATFKVALGYIHQNGIRGPFPGNKTGGSWSLQLT
jgi:hypothetical protein